MGVVSLAAAGNWGFSLALAELGNTTYWALELYFSWWLEYGWSDSDYNAAQDSWGLGLAELGNTANKNISLKTIFTIAQY